MANLGCSCIDRGHAERSWAVYRYLGLKFLSKSWFNLVWAAIDLAKNARNSVEQIERSYAKHLPLSREMAEESAEF